MVVVEGRCAVSMLTARRLERPLQFVPSDQAVLSVGFFFVRAEDEPPALPLALRFPSGRTGALACATAMGHAKRDER